VRLRAKDLPTAENPLACPPARAGAPESAHPDGYHLSSGRAETATRRIGPRRLPFLLQPAPAASIGSKRSPDSDCWIGLRLFHKPRHVAPRCAPRTTRRSSPGSNQVDAVLDGPQIALHEVDLEGRCEQIQWRRIYETASATTNALIARRNSGASARQSGSQREPAARPGAVARSATVSLRHDEQRSSSTRPHQPSRSNRRRRETAPPRECDHATRRDGVIAMPRPQQRQRAIPPPGCGSGPFSPLLYVEGVAGAHDGCRGVAITPMRARSLSHSATSTRRPVLAGIEQAPAHPVALKGRDGRVRRVAACVRIRQRHAV
jgi:hypothetical protein